jgi:hypothetical protein
MNMLELRSTRPVAVLLLAACASGSGSADTSTTPAPKPDEPAAPASNPGRGPALNFRAARNVPYRIERHDSLTLQYEGGASQNQVRDRTAFVRLTLAEAPASGGFRVTIVLDSVLATENGMPAPFDSMAIARGTQWSATLTPAGELQGLQANRSSLLGDELASTLRLLLPHIPQGGVRENMAWSDTTRYQLVADAFPGTETAATRYRATGSDKGIELVSEGTYTRSGTRKQAEQELEMTASGSRKATHRISQEGTLVSANGSDAGDMTISVPAVGQTVPVKQSSTYTITSLSTGSR